jgi:poly(hydroxyalkanoate) granule-associated protein
VASKSKTKGFDPETLTGPAKKIWLAGLGALATAEDEGSKLFRTLVERGEQLEGRGRERIEGLVGSVGERAGSVRSDVGEKIGHVGDNVDELVMRAMRQLGVPSREELEILTRRIEELAQSLERAQANRKAPASSATTKKAVTKKSATKKTTAKKATGSRTPARKTKTSTKKD